MLLVPAMIGALGVSALVGVSTSHAADAFTFEEIKAKALAEVNGTLLDFDYEVKGTNSYYEIDILASNQKYELKYNAVTGKLIEKDVERVKSKDLTKYQSTTNPTFSLDQIMAKALEKVGSGEVTSAEYEVKGSIGYYEVDVVTTTAKYELKYNATTGELLSNTSKQLKVKQTPKQTTTTSTNQTLLTVEVIKAKALAEVNGTITEVDLERKGTQSYYEVEVLTATAEYELKYNAVTGELLKKEQDSRD